MSLSKPLAAVLAALVAFGGVAAAGTGVVGPQLATDDATSTTNVDAQAAYDNGTVTVTVTDAGEPLQNVTVYADDEAVGTTDASGTVTFDTNAIDELELELELVGDDFEGELEYQIQDGELVLSEEEYEYEHDDAEADDADEEEDDADEEEDDADEEAAEEDETDEDDADEEESEADDADEEESEADDADDDDADDEESA